MAKYEETSCGCFDSEAENVFMTCDGLHKTIITMGVILLSRQKVK